MAIISRAAQENLLRTVYLKDMRRQFNLKSILLQIIGRNNTNFAPGKEISIALHAGAGEGHTYSDAGNLPPPSSEQIERAVFNYKWMTNRIQITGDFEDDADSKKAAEMSPLQLALQSVVRNGRHDLNYDMFSDGSGKVATVATASSATECVVDDIAGLRNNLRVDVILTASGGIGAGGVKSALISLNRSTKTVTLLGGATWADGTGSDLNSNPTDYAIYRAGAYNMAPYGLGAAVSASNPPTGVTQYGGIDRSDDANDFWRSHRLHNSGSLRGVTLKLMQDMLDEIDIYSEGQVGIIVCGHQVWSGVAHALTNSKRYPGQMMTLNGWCQAVDFAGIPVVRDKHCPPDRMYFLDPSTFTIYQNNEGSWMDKDGAILARVEGKVAYQAAWHRRLQLVCRAPICNGYIEDLKYAAPS